MAVEKRNQFGSKIGLIAATLGSAVGLGNVWRFPAEAQSNGGAAFLLLYVGCVLLLGIPVMLAEMSLGRAGRSDAVGVFRRLAPGKAWWVAGAVAITASYLITGFYMVVEGWTAEYLFHSFTGDLYAAGRETVSQADSLFVSRMDAYINADWPPLIFTWAVLLINLGVLMGGVQKGIERLSNVMMPLLFIVLLVLCCMTLSLDGAGDGLRWFLSPDFSKITWSAVINALGQTFFSLSLGMGILVTYSSYYPSTTRLAPTAVTVALMSLLVAVLTGCVIFPSVSHFGLADHSLRGATLVFQTLPEVFSFLPGTTFWSILFFILLFVAAITSTVSLLEVAVAFLRDSFGMSRPRAVVLTVLPLFGLSSLCSLSFGSLSGFRIAGLTVFDFLDYFATNLLLPLVSIAICVYLGWFAPKGLLKDQLTNGGTVRSRLTAAVLFVVRWIAPALIALILVFNFL